jgi:TonB family protein
LASFTEFGRSKISPIGWSLIFSVFLHALLMLASGDGLMFSERKATSHIRAFTGGIYLQFRNAEISTPTSSITKLDPEIVSQANLASNRIPVVKENLEKPLANQVSSPGKGKEHELNVSSLPIMLVGIEPRYPLPLLVKNVRGSVSATFRIGSEGRFEDIQIIESSPEGVFDKVVIDAISAAIAAEGSVRKGNKFKITFVFDPSGIGVPAAVHSGH